MIRDWLRFLAETWRMRRPKPPLSSSDEVTRRDTPAAKALADLAKNQGPHDPQRFTKTQPLGRVKPYDRCVCADSGCRTEPMCSLCPRRKAS